MGVLCSMALNDPGLDPVDYIETEIATFLAVLGKTQSHTFGRWKVEFIVPREFKDDMWPCSDQQGYEVKVVVMKRRAAGVPDPQELQAQLAQAQPLDAVVESFGNSSWHDSWTAGSDGE